MQVSEIVNEVNHRNRPLTLVTGGEPMAQKDILPLLSALAEARPTVQLETSGAFDLDAVDPRIHRIIDIKTPGSGEAEKNHWQNLSSLRSGDEIKLVVCSREDYEWCRETIRKYSNELRDIPVLLSPVWGGPFETSEMVKWMLEDHIPARMQLQLHKTIWGAKATGV